MSNYILSNEYVTDTMALVLHLESRRSSSSVRSIFEAADNGQTTVFIPAIVLAEILYLYEKGRISTSVSDVETLIANNPAYEQFPLSLDIVFHAQIVDDIPELHDRLIGSTASLANLELITNDPKIQLSKYVKTIW